MKQSFDGLSSMRLLSRKLGVSVLAAVIVAAAACGGNQNNTCPNLAIANGLLGQTTYILGTGNGVSGTGYASPVAVAVGPSGATTPFYVADTFNNRILGYSTIPGFSTQLGITTPPPAGSFGQAASFVLGQGATGTDFTSDVSNNCPSGTTTPTCSIGLARPSKVSLSTDGQYMVVADSANNRVLVWGPGNLPSATNIVAPSVVIGQPDFNSKEPNQNGNVSASTLSNPTSAMINGNVLVVADKGNNRVLIWTQFPLSNDQPADVELGQAPTQTVGSTTTTCTGNTQFCFTTDIGTIDSFSTTNNNYILAMDEPTDVYTDGNILVVSDTANNRVLYWSNVPTNAIDQQDQIPQAVLGQTQFGQDTSGSGAQHLFGPTGVSADNHNIYVADQQNNRVLLFPLEGTVPIGEAATGVYGQQDFTHVAYNDDDQNNIPGDQQNNQTNDNPTQNTLYGPEGVATYIVDSGSAAGTTQVFIVDSNNNRVLQFPLDTIENNTEVDGAVNGSEPNNCNGINPQV